LIYGTFAAMWVKKIIFRPNFLKDLDHANASYHSIQGEIKAGWKQTSPGVFEYKVTVPSNCSAVVVLPGGEKKLEPGEHLMHVRK
jgi:alpha-L-rhamnosidase